MHIVGDFHIHSRYSRATSKNMNVVDLDLWAQKKGVTVLGTGDFTHHKWLEELEESLEPAEEGLYRMKMKRLPAFAKATAGEVSTRFVLTSEISAIYSKGGKVRKVHTLIFAPSFEVVKRINGELRKIGNLHSDGRPILGIDVKELAKIAFDASPDCMVIPAHCLLPGTIIHCQDDFTKKIEDVKEGDTVYTHQNKWQKVTQVLTRAHKGKAYHIQPHYFREGLTTTPEHPFYAIKTQKHCLWQHSFCRPGCKGRQHCCKKHIAKEENFRPQWVQAQNLEKGDVLLYPRFTDTEDREYVLLQNFLNSPSQLSSPIHFDLNNTRDQYSIVTMKGSRTMAMPSCLYITKEFCRLVGYFLAEGCVGEDLISFTFANHEEQYLQDVRMLMQQVFAKQPSKERNKDGSTELIYYSKILKEFFSSFCYQTDVSSHRAFTKAIPLWMLALPQEKQVEIIRGWWRGDAGYTTSRLLMNQIKIIFLRLGIIPSIYIDTVQSHESRGNHFIEDRKIEASHDLFSIVRLSFFEDSFGLLNEKEFHRFISKTSIRHGWLDENYAYLPIRDISISEYDGEVYNLEVENDNSYVSEFATIHNCWTPWFSVFGSKSGFDSLEECFEELTPHIYAIETGLSSDPAMNWRLSQLDSISLISNSDCHSSPKIAREANVFDTELSYNGIMDAIRKKDKKRFLYTIEFFPEEGKYHYDGHRDCKVSMKPSERLAQKNNNCPVCGRPLIIGVLSRVEELADRPEGFVPKNSIPFKNLIPLQEIIGDVWSVGPQSKRVQKEYEKLLAELGGELTILLQTPEAELKKATTFEVAEGIIRVREGKVWIDPGYDGVYGKIHIFKEGEEPKPQKALF